MIGLYFLVKAALKEIFKVALAAYVWRHFSGAHYHGEERSDATWTRHGSKGYGRDGRASPWEMKPRLHRAAWRWAITFSVIGVITGLVLAPLVTVCALGGLTVYGIAVLGFIGQRKWILRLHDRHITNPIVESIAVLLRMNKHAVRRNLHIDPENIKDEGEVGYYEFTPEQTPSAEMLSSIERVIDAHLPVDIEFIAQFQQAPKIGVIRAGLRPPEYVAWEETLDAMRNAAYGDIVIGKDRFKQVFTANFIHLEDPHWAFNVQTKRGKSNFLGLVAVQVLHQDPLAQVIAIDPKEESLIDFLGTPWDSPKPLLKGVTMANDPENVEAMWAAIRKGRKLMEQRRADYARNRGKKYPICLVILDELNKFCHMTDEKWAEKLEANKRLPKEEQESLPKRCPVYGDIIDMLHMGRFVGVHLIAVAQDFRASLLGGEARNGFGLRGLGGYIPSQWKMFIGSSGPVPEPQAGRGRWIFWQGERQDWVQITHCDVDQAYAFAAEGREQHDAEAALGYAPASVAQGDGTVLSALISDAATDGQAIEKPPEKRVIVGTRAAAEYLGYDKVGTFRKARERYMEDHGPIPGEYTTGRSKVPHWPAEALDEWQRNRPRAGKGDSDSVSEH